MIFEVHGGAYFYGFKEINRSHAIELARHGYAVVSVSYPLYPAVDFLTQLRDLASALEWVSKSSGRYLLDTNQVFFTGDSAGVTLVVNAGLPPVWMATSTDDFLEATSLELGVELRKLGIDHELLDYRAAPRECLPHNYIVGMPWLKETREAVESMLSFFAEHMAPRMSLNASE